jgi:uncharacterized LabA/DUF88 family protein
MLPVLLPTVLRDWWGFFSTERALSKDLRAVVVVDYQNVHLTGHGIFDSTKYLPKHETLVDPLRFAQALLRERNARQRTDLSAATLRKVLVFRGQPSSEHDPQGYARSLAQQSQWQRDARVEVTLRPLKYEYQRDAMGRPATDHNGRRMVVGPPREKGVDVLCALAAIREAQDESTDLVILASSDSDLAPVLDEVRLLGTAKIETFCWYDEIRRIGYQIHPSDRSKPVWNTLLNEQAFKSCWDLTQYQ